MINTIKLNLMKNARKKISKAIVWVTPKVLKATKILSASTGKRLAIEQGIFLKREQLVRKRNFQRDCKLQGFILRL